LTSLSQELTFALRMLQHTKTKKRISDISEEFLIWLQVERRFAKSSIVSYRSRLKCFVRDVGDIKLGEFEMSHIFQLKRILHERENTEVFIGVALACIKGLLKYYRNLYSAPLKINPDEITIPKRPRREVVFLFILKILLKYSKIIIIIK